MTTGITILAAVILLITIASSLALWHGLSKMASLADSPPLKPEGQKLVSIIVAACNEEEKIEQAMRSLLALDYRHIEIIAINDRSTDSTGKILTDLAADHRALQVLHIDSLPANWMGKLHALQKGAELASGEYLLFSDADVILEKSALARAMARVSEKKLDHLTVIFKNISPGWLLNSLILDAGAGLLLLFRPWLAQDRNSSCFIGVGAFNLVKKSCYLAVGGHSAIAMHPVDDLMLGRLLKQRGFSQECLLAPDLVMVPWYSSVAEMVEGLTKNALALLNYRFSLVLPVVLFCSALTILPPWGVLLSERLPAGLFLATVLLRIAAFLWGAKLLALSPWCACGALVAPYLSSYILLRSAWKNSREGGISWRGTFYPLEKLRENGSLLPPLN
ncbi:MAG: glycosyltransferase [Desulforhopalus sp.]|jgi:hypothetical protein|nr:glycosyltransferase [Desulforhopalus sp.]